MKNHLIANKHSSRSGLGVMPVVCAVLVGMAATGQLQAENFGIHFLGNTSDPVTGTAGVAPIANWNNIAPGAGSTTITASDGSTTATLALSGGQAGNAWGSGSPGDGANFSLMDGYLDAGTYGGSSATVTISGLTNSHYNVYIYTFADGSRPQNSGDWLPNYTVNGTTYYVPVLGNSTASTYDTTSTSVGGVGFTGFIQGTPGLANNNSPAVTANFGNYIEIAYVATVSGAITIEPENDTLTYRSPLNGIELVASNTPVAPATTLPTYAPTVSPIYAGTPVTLSESAMGAPPLSYQWLADNGTHILRPVGGATGTNLLVNTTAFSPTNYEYAVIVTNSFGASTSAVAVLNVVAASRPLLVSNITPSSVVADAGGQQTFSATFNGTLPIAYQWQANTDSGMTNIPNATNTSFTLTNLQLANSGSYQVVATNSVGGPVASSAATLTVLAAAPFPSAVLAANPVGYWRLNETANPSSGTVVALDATHNFNGTYGNDSADAVPGPTPAAGFPGLERINTAARFTNGVANSFVTLPAFNLNANTVTITAWIYPIGTPAYYAGIVFSRNGGDASGFCFTQNGQIGYTWNQNNQNTWGWLSGLVPPTGQWSFIALVVSPTNAIAYLCNTNGQSSATNAIASSVEAFSGSTLIGGDPADGGNGARTFNGVMDEVAIFNSSLSEVQIFNLYFNAVGGAPQVGATTASPSNTVYSGTTVTLSATVLGLAPFQYQWQMNGSNLVGATNATLVLTNALVSNSGSYAVVVGNSSGTNQSAALVLTVRPPGGPVFTQQPSPASATNYVGGLVTFTAGVDGSPPIQLQWRHNGTNIANATAPSLTLASLQSYQAGAYTLVASSPYGVTNSTPALLTVLPPPNPSALNVLTYHNDNTRDGANTNEVLLTLANVNVSTFGRLITYPVDGYIYAQPLYVANLAIAGQGSHNAVFVATEHNSVYAFDADGNVGTNGGLLWFTNLGTSALSNNHEFGDRYNGGNYTDIVPEVGVTGTPVINLASGTLYVAVRTRVVGVTTNYYHSIHALNITNGTERPYSPVVVTNSVPGTGVDNTNGLVVFNPLQENQRPGLTLAGGMLYVAYGSFADTDPYHGWVLGFNATNLQQSAKYVFNTTPNATVPAFGGNAGEGALWMGGNGIAVDANTNLYFETANGSFSANTNGGDYSDSFVRLSTTNGLAVADYFTPYNQLSLANGDTDLGSGGPILLPDSAGSAAHPHLIVGAGKEGTIHLVDRDNLGHFNAANDSQIVQELPGAIGSAFSTPAYFNNQIYYQGSGDVTKGFIVTNGVIVATPASQATTSFSALGGTPSISANGTNNGIVWTIQSDAFASSGPAVLHAYNATNLALELYNSSQNLARDNPGGAIQMTTPTICNGKVFVGAQYALSIFGNGLFLAMPVIAPAGGLFTNSVTVTLSDSSANTSIYYTLDGTTPTTNSILYTGPFVLTTSASVHAIAAELGAVNSGVASAGFVDSSATGKGTGLLGEYWTNTTGAAFTNSGFVVPPTLTRTDAVVNFNWSSSGPAPNIGQTNFAARWIGSVQPQYSETYTLTTVANDGVRLWINGQLLVSDWATNTTAQTNSASVALEAQQLYNIRLDYFQATGNAIVQLLWSSPSTPQAVIAQTQLYPYSNPPPAVVLTGPTNGSAFTAAASVSFVAEADAQYNPLTGVSFYANGALLGTATNAPYALTATGFSAGNYTLTATATDGSGLSSTSAPVNITVAAGSGLPYGLTTNGNLAPFLNGNMPGSYTGPIPAVLSGTGAYSDTPNRTPSLGLIPYIPNTPLWSDGASKSRYLGLPNGGGFPIPANQIGFAPTGQWTFPAGTVFVKNFDLVVDETNTNAPLRRLETRLLVRDTNGAVYGVTYKWRPDDSDADLLTNSLTEAILITNATGVATQNWYYPSPADCLTCHTPVAGYVLGVNARQLNGSCTYPSTGVTDNQLRTLNRLGLLFPAFNEANITNFEQLSSVTNQNAPLVQRARSYLDANCAQCHQPGGTGITFDARYDTPLTNQNIINAVAAVTLGYDNAKVVAPSDIWRSVLYDRMNTLAAAIKMPPLARNTIDSNAVAVMAGWINSLGGTPALAPPVLLPAPGIYTNKVMITLQPPDTNAALFYTLDGTLPTTNSTHYSGSFNLSSSALVTANAFEAGYVNSVAVSGQFTIVPPLYSLFAPGFLSNGSFQIQYWAPSGQTYVLQYSTNLVSWIPLSTNVPASAPFLWVDPGAANAAHRFYRVVAP